MEQRLGQIIRDENDGDRDPDNKTWKYVSSAKILHEFME